ncbi:DapH/DapD/GlmU-related protein [Phycisphaerales bacterium AB-hyl4]|uniref:DapH/DapD/GlmU-related protein n=1 Tax=Natronomicrosphaera hydrolytica TaxID=3242702 RepID=A0ABV4UB35_9BACT
MSFWIWLDSGLSTPPTRKNLRERLSLWWGRRLALRHNHVQIDPTARISAESRINPRHGAIRIGAHTSIAPHAILQGNITLGDHCSVQAFSMLVGYGTPENPTGQIQIGNHVRIAPHVMMIAGNHVFDDVDRPITEQGVRHDPITIEDDVWIAGRVTLTAGVTIGRGSVIAAGAVVTRDIPPWSVAAGVPARVLRQRKAEPATS